MKNKEIAVISTILGLTFGLIGGGFLYANRLDEIMEENLQLKKDNIALDRANQILIEELRGNNHESKINR